MRQNSLLSALLTIINLAVVAVTVYIAVDAVDMARLQNARTEQSLTRLAGVLDKFTDAVNNIRVAAPADSAYDSRAAGNNRSSQSSNGRAVGFVNDDLRDPDAEEGGSIISHTASFPGNLNSIVNNEAFTGTVWSTVTDTLAGLNNNDNTLFEPLMAERWEISPDGLVYTIYLRKNVMWQSFIDPVTKKEVPAKNVTSRDFLFYWETIQNPLIPCEAIRNYYELLEGFEIIDDYTFKVIWKEPYSLGERFTLGLQPLPEHYYRPDPDWDDKRFADEFVSSPRNQWVVGTGPFKLVRWDKNSEMVLEVDENYYGRKPAIKNRVYRLIPDPTVSFLEFKRDKLDLYGLQPTQWHEESPEPDFRLVTPDIKIAPEDSLAWDELKKEGELPEDYKFEKYQYNGSSWTYIGYNQSRPLFADREVRVALTHLVDRQRILDEVYMGLGEIISGPFVPRSPYYNHDVQPLPFDTEKAKQILADAGWEDTDGDGILDKAYDGSGKRKPFTFTFIIPSASVISRKIAAIVEQDMLKAKIKPEIKPIEWSVYTQTLDSRDFDVCSLGWYGGIEGDPYQIWHGSGATREGSSNHVAYNSAEANRLIEEGRRTIDKETRYEIYHRLHEVIAADQPYTFLIAPTATLAKNKRFHHSLVYKGGGMDSTLEWIPRDMQVVR